MQHASQAPILSVRDLHVRYGAITALSGISIDVYQGEIVTIIGANGAGKSTTLRAISGLVRPESGAVTFRSEDMLRLPGHQRVERGIVHVPEGRRIFANLTVKENLDVASYTRKRSPALEAQFERVYTLFPRLKERGDQQASTLSGGEQQMLAIGRALVIQGSLVLLDEPSMGLAPILVREIFEKIREINRDGTTILLVEQNAFQALKIAERAYVLAEGRVVMEGRAVDIAARDDVRKAYLGI